VKFEKDAIKFALQLPLTSAIFQLN